jgi:hypothetical protein
MTIESKWVYLVEKLVQGKPELVAICSSFSRANKFIEAEDYLISKIEINKKIDEAGKLMRWYI